LVDLALVLSDGHTLVIDGAMMRRIVRRVRCVGMSSVLHAGLGEEAMNPICWRLLSNTSCTGPRIAMMWLMSTSLKVVSIGGRILKVLQAARDGLAQAASSSRLLARGIVGGDGARTCTAAAG